MEKKYLSEYEVMLATLKELGGDVNKKYASLYDVELAILKAVQEGGGGGGGGLTPEQVHNIVESYNYTTMQAVENKQFMKQKKLTLNGNDPLQILDEDGNVLSYNEVKALVDNKALFVYMLVDNAFYIPCGDMVIPSGHNAVEFSSAFIVNGTANIARIIIDTADEVLYEQYILVDTDTLRGYATKDEIPSVEGLASEEYVNGQIDSVRSEIPSVEGLASTDYVDEQIQDTKNLIPSVEGLASETFVTEEIENNNETIAATYATKEEVAGAGMQMEVVDSLPETGAPKTIYLVPAKTATELNVKDEYVWVDGKWEVIGSTKINLDDYATIEYVDTVAGEIRAEIPSVEGLASEQWVEDKGYLTEHQPLKTINGESIVGEGDIEIQGGGSSNVVNLTQTEYDELETKDPNTIYNITDAINPYVKREEIENYAEKDSVMQRYGGELLYFWSGTQEQYDALGEYHDDTFYIIKD